jgi:hypothetical protein
VTDLSARLPGQASLAADGMLTTAGDTGFNGNIHLVVNQPATFAAWWRGNAKEGSGRLLSAFDLAGKAAIADGHGPVRLDRGEDPRPPAPSRHRP